MHFCMGDWRKFVETSVRAGAVYDQITVRQQLNSLNLRFLGSDWTDPLGHNRQLAATIKLGYSHSPAKLRSSAGCPKPKLTPENYV